MRAEPARLVWLTWQADAGAHECLIRKCACRRALERAAPSTRRKRRRSASYNASRFTTHHPLPSRFDGERSDAAPLADNDGAGAPLPGRKRHRPTAVETPLREGTG